MKNQITITTQISFLADITPVNADDWCKLFQKLEERPSPATSAYELALSSVLGRVAVQEQATEVHVQPACRVCGCTEDNCEQCIEAQGFPCSWVEVDLCSRCANKTEQ